MSQLRRLNNRKMRAIRKDIVYEAVITDLCLLGIIKQEDAEILIGRKIDDSLTSPAVLANDGLPEEEEEEEEEEELDDDTEEEELDDDTEEEELDDDTEEEESDDESSEEEESDKDNQPPNGDLA